MTTGTTIYYYDNDKGIRKSVTRLSRASREKCRRTGHSTKRVTFDTEKYGWRYVCTECGALSR